MMPARPSKGLIALNADGDRLDDARRRLLADWCRLVSDRLHANGSASDANIVRQIPSDEDVVDGFTHAADVPSRRTVTPVDPVIPSPKTPLSDRRRDTAASTAVTAGPIEPAESLSLSSPASLMSAASSTVPPAAPSSLPAVVTELGLPPRMSQVLTGLLAGAAEKQIARDLALSPHTIHAYVKQIYKRLDVSSRGELLARFVTLNR